MMNRERLPRLNRPVPLPLPLPPPSMLQTPTNNHGPGCGKVSSLQRNVALEDLERLMLLGSGSEGKVYKVQHRLTGQLFALKVIQEKHESIRRQIIQEMEILRTTKNRHVIQCYGVFENGGEVSFVLEYMDCGTLADVLQTQGKIQEHHLAEVTKQVLTGLCYLHKSKIVHRDIKPSNLLLNRRQEVKIADFGVSTVLAHTMAQCNSFVGTCAYMSPERMNPDANGGYCGASADIWSLGLTLFECFLGRFPCLKPGEKSDWVTLMFVIGLGEPPPPPPDASLEFQDFLRSCLRRDPNQRPSAANLLAHPFLTKYDGQPRSLAALLRSPPL